MLNSLTVFLAFISFIAFGYMSLLRLLTKQHLPSGSSFASGMLKCLKSWRLLGNLGCSAFFVSLPATSLLLFWGWGPALIWLIVFHLLIESVFHLQYSTQKTGLRIADHLLRTEQGPKAWLEQGLIQAFFLLSMAVIVALVATLLDRQPGLLFALVFLLPARRLFSHPSASLPLALRMAGALGLLAMGLAFSDQLGFSVYGDWAPLGTHVPWLVFNMPTLIAAILVVSVFKLEGNQGFKHDLSLFAGAIIVLLVIAMVIKLVWLRPVLDAPLNSGAVSGATLPHFMSLSLFVFTGFAAFLIRLLNEEENRVKHSATQYARLQGGSLIHTCYMALLVLSLASALGIGAWKTHFIEWSGELDILNYLNLAISSNLNLIYTDANSGTILHTVLLAALCFTGFSFLLMCAQQLTLEEADTETVASMIIEAKIPQAVGIFIASAYFIGNGISVDVWVLIGLLAWVLCCHLLIGLCLSGENNTLFTLLTVSVFTIGLGQSIMFSLRWLSESQYLWVIVSMAVLCIASTLWLKDLPQLLKKLGREEKADFL